MSISTLTSKGQTTIPKQVREHLKIGPGDKLDFVIESEGRVVIRPAKLDVRNSRGYSNGMMEKYCRSRT